MASKSSKAMRRNRQNSRVDKYTQIASWYRHDRIRWRRNKVKQAMREGVTEALPLFKNDIDDWW